MAAEQAAKAEAEAAQLLERQTKARLHEVGGGDSRLSGGLMAGAWQAARAEAESGWEARGGRAVAPSSTPRTAAESWWITCMRGAGKIRSSVTIPGPSPPPIRSGQRFDDQQPHQPPVGQSLDKDDQGIAWRLRLATQGTKDDAHVVRPVQQRGDGHFGGSRGRRDLIGQGLNPLWTWSASNPYCAHSCQGVTAISPHIGHSAQRGRGLSYGTLTLKWS